MTRLPNLTAAAILPRPPASAAAMLQAMERAAEPARAVFDRQRGRAIAALDSTGARQLVLGFLDNFRRSRSLYPDLPVSETTWRLYMDLSDLIFTDRAVMTLRHPVSGAAMKTDDGDPITITLGSMDSAAWRRTQSDILAEAPAGKISGDQMENHTFRLLAGVTLGWDNVIVDGVRPACNTEEAERLYRKLPWLRQQVEAFVGNRQNFHRKAAA